MPRRAPDQVQEHRITFGTFERQFVTETKNDIEKGVKVAAISAVAVPVAAVTGFGLLGYGIYKGALMIGKGLNEFQLMDWSLGEGLPTAAERKAGREGWSLIQKFQFDLYAFSGGWLGKSREEIEKEIFIASMAPTGGGGDF
tara:strand:+ start:475 stop:900 length:426 start_codon:yes stop_codon:yes gene_type:complete